MIPDEVVRRIAHIANQQGLRGKKVSVQWVPPQKMTDDYMGSVVVIDQTPESATDALFE